MKENMKNCGVRGKKMPEFELFQYYRKMCERNIVLDFQGAISQDMLVGMAELIKSKFSQEYGRANIVKKIFAVFIEMAQNIAFYSTERVHLDTRHKDVGAGIIVVTENVGVYTVTSGNMVGNDTVADIVDHCNVINSMNKEELKQFFKQKIKSSRVVGKRGAGVGLIDIARKSGNPIMYEVTSVDDVNSFLVLSVKIQDMDDNNLETTIQETNNQENNQENIQENIQENFQEENKQEENNNG